MELSPLHPATCQAAIKLEFGKKKSMVLWHGNWNSDHFILRHLHIFTRESGKVSTCLPRVFWVRVILWLKSPQTTASFSLGRLRPGAWQPSLRMAEPQGLLLGCCGLWAAGLSEGSQDVWVETCSKSHCLDGFWGDQPLNPEGLC